MQYIALDIGGSSVKYALLDESMNISARGSISCGRTGMEDLLSPMRVIRNRLGTEYAGVAVSMPGRIDTARGIAFTGGAFTFIHQDPIGEILQRVFNKPVTIANDGKCAANAELHDGALKDISSGAVLILGTGIGGGVVIDRKVRLGSDFGAGEFSLLPTSFAEFAGFDMTKAMETPLPIWANNCSAAGLVTSYCRRIGVENDGTIDGRKFFDAYERKEPDAAAVFDEFCANLAVGIFTIQSIIDVEKIAVGGGISARPEVTAGIEQSVNALFDRLTGCPFQKPAIVKCRYGNDANLFGALRFHLERIQAQH